MSPILLPSLSPKHSKDLKDLKSQKSARNHWEKKGKTCKDGDLGYVSLVKKTTGKGTQCLLLLGTLKNIFLNNQFSSVTQSCQTLCDLMDYSVPDLPVHHQLLELTQTHVHELVMSFNHLILCHALLFLPSIFPNIRWAKGLELQLQHQSFQRIFTF